MNKLYVFCGIPFSGKSFVSKKIAREFNYQIVDLDEVKFEIFGKDVKDENIDQNGWDKIYQEMYQGIEDLLKKGETVIHDTGNFTKYERGLVKKIADNLNLNAITVFIDTPYEIAKQRLIENKTKKTRFDVSNESFESTIREMEPPDETEKHVTFKHGTDLDLWIKENFNKQ